MLDLQRPLADLVLDHPETARVLQRHRLDFCCKGHVALGDAMAARGLDGTAVTRELEAAIDQRRQPRGVDARVVPTPALIQHIVDRHHAYLRQALPFLGPLAEKVARVHGDGEPRLFDLRDVVLALRTALEPHLENEERVLFPAMLAGGASELVTRELGTMQAEHEMVGALLHRAREITADFSLPTTACNSYRTLFRELEALETDVLEHVHVETHVLAPRFASGAPAMRVGGRTAPLTP